jgi:hypothetical protein
VLHLLSAEHGAAEGQTTHGCFGIERHGPIAFPARPPEASQEQELHASACSIRPLLRYVQCHLHFTFVPARALVPERFDGRGTGGGAPVLSGIIGVAILGRIQRKEGRFKKWIIICMCGKDGPTQGPAWLW